MKTVGIREAKALLSAYVARSQKERVLIMRRGTPVAVLTGIEGKDLEDVVLENDPSFWKMIHDSRRQRSSISLEDASRRLRIRPSEAGTRGRSRRSKS
jgi:prevent-host-death family protein